MSSVTVIVKSHGSAAVMDPTSHQEGVDYVYREVL